MKAIRTVATEIRAIVADGDDIVRITLADRDDWELPPFAPGDHIDVHLPNGLVRSYSLCGRASDRQHYHVAIKREDAGRGGSIAAHALEVGMAVPVSLPRGTFHIARDGRSHVFIAGGIGITPFIPMAMALAEADAPFALEVLHRGAAPLQSWCRSQLTSEHVRFHCTGTAEGRVDLAALIGAYVPGRHVYCCGPDGLMEAVTALTSDWPAGQVHIEHFVPPARPVDPDAKPYTVHLSISKKTLAVPPEASLLSVLRQHDIDVDASCEGGICGACRVRWLDGQPVHHDRVLTHAERAHEVIVCVSGCASRELVLAL